MKKSRRSFTTFPPSKGISDDDKSKGNEDRLETDPQNDISTLKWL